MNTYLNQSGFSLLETLIAASLMAFALFALLTIQTHLYQKNYDIYLHNVALHQAQSLLERLRADRSAASRSMEKNIWQLNNKKLLPNPEGSLTCDGVSCRVHLKWHEMRSHAVSVSSVL